MHRQIKTFEVQGEFLNDSQIPTVRVQYETLLLQDMRSKGYVPVLDLDTQWSTEYDASDDSWHFELAVYAIYIGRKKAKQWEGWSSGKLVPRPRSIQRVTSEGS